MNQQRYPVSNYVPYNPTNELSSKKFGRCLHTTLQKMTYDRIMSDLEYHFQNCYVINFDLIHHECRGSMLKHSRRYYETIFREKVNKEIDNDSNRQLFISHAIKSEREDVFFEKDIFYEHFNREELEKKLQKKGAFLSAMKKKSYFKKNKTDDCKSLSF